MQEEKRLCDGSPLTLFFITLDKENIIIVVKIYELKKSEWENK